jgi:hypothetical protein
LRGLLCVQTELLEVEDPDALAQLQAPRWGDAFADDDGECEQAAASAEQVPTDDAAAAGTSPVPEEDFWSSQWSKTVSLRSKQGLAVAGGRALKGADVYKRWLRGKPELRCVPQQLPG